MNKTNRALVFLGVALTWASFAYSQESNQSKLVGDVGMAVFRTPPITKTNESSKAWLPYVYADYGNFYARVDTFGYKLTPIGTGHLEVAGRVSFEGYESGVAGIEHRSRPQPIGLGTFQQTAYGAFTLYAFRDAVSGGSMLDAAYLAEMSVGNFQIYPQIGIERRDRKYVEKLYGVSALESQRSGLAIYTPGNSISANAAVAIEYPLMDQFKLTLQIRKRWLDQAIYESPLVNIRHQVSSLIAVTKTLQ